MTFFFQYVYVKVVTPEICAGISTFKSEDRNMGSSTLDQNYLVPLMFVYEELKLWDDKYASTEQ